LLALTRELAQLEGETPALLLLSPRLVQLQLLLLLLLMLLRLVRLLLLFLQLVLQEQGLNQ
jgi:hypothetical protein